MIAAILVGDGVGAVLKHDANALEMPLALRGSSVQPPSVTRPTSVKRSLMPSRTMRTKASTVPLARAAIVGRRGKVERVARARVLPDLRQDM